MTLHSRRVLCHWSDGFIVCSISLPVAAAFVGRALSAALTGVFNTARPYAYLSI